jgi:valyl-tRNA synthetase
MEQYQIGEAERQVHDFVWSELCDWYIEMAKLRLRSESTADSPSPAPYLIAVLDISLRLLHPFMPFVTEELWQQLQPDTMGVDSPRSIVVASYPTPCSEWEDAAAERSIEAVQEIVRALRNLRAERRMEPSHWLEARLYTGTILAELQQMLPVIEVLARTHILALEHRDERVEAAAGQSALVLTDVELVVADATHDDAGRLREQLQKEATTTESRLQAVMSRLQDETFLSRAPADVIERQRSLAESLQDKLQRLRSELQELG